MSKARCYKFRLYVTGVSPNSSQAVTNLEAFCREHLPEQHEIEIVDVLRYPNQALSDGILLTPTLVKISPAPVRKIIGNLSERRAILVALQIPV
jgi:circadian clock protein KaiB